jgi:ubiquitin-protein ligase
MAYNSLNKKLWTEITRLKLLAKPDAPVRFLLHQSPFDEIDEEETVAAANSKEPIITGRKLPTSDIYKECAFLIEIKIMQAFPWDPREVRFLTPIYHLNVS